MEEATELQRELEDLYSDSLGDPSFLWDTSKVWELVRLTRNFERNRSKRYKYVGRARAEQLYRKVMGREAGQHMQVLGARGSGKSTAMSTISGYLIGSKQRQVVYLHAERFIQDPHSVLLDALLVASGKNCSGLVSSTTLEDLVDWCCWQSAGSLLFVVDEWDQFEREAELEKRVIQASSNQMLIKVSTVYSRERHIWSESDKADYRIETAFFDGPYNSSELETWIGQSGLTNAQLQALDRLTGGMPGLLQFYEDVNADETAFTRRIEEVYTVKLRERFISLLGTRKELSAAMNLVISGELGHELTADSVDLTCFYMDEEGLFYPLSPCLRTQAEFYIMEQHEILQGSLGYYDIQTWAPIVRLDCEKQSPTNPARVAWNVEGFVITVMRYRKQVFSSDFKHYRTYEPGREMDALTKLGVEELTDGVLLGPDAFSEKAVDVVFIKLVGNALQITADHSCSVEGQAEEAISCSLEGGGAAKMDLQEPEVDCTAGILLRYA